MVSRDTAETPNAAGNQPDRAEDMTKDSPVKQFGRREGGQEYSWKSLDDRAYLFSVGIAASGKRKTPLLSVPAKR
jgi:hypothetical protein